MENCIFWEACGMSVSEAQKKASVKYLEKLDEVRVRAGKRNKESLEKCGGKQREIPESICRRCCGT